MRNLDLASLAPTSACVAVAQSSAIRPDFLLADHGAAGLQAARWRVSKVTLCEPKRLDEHVLSYCACGSATTTLVVDGVRTRSHRHTHSISFVPARRRVQWALESSGEVEVVHLYIPSEAMAHRADADRAEGTSAAPPPLPELANLSDPWLDGFFRLMLAEYAACARDHSLEASAFLDDTAALVIRHVASLLDERSGKATANTDIRARVSPLQPFILRRVEGFVHANLQSSIGVERLAGMASMSVGHFVRAFHVATGLTPHQYVLECRLDRACTLLRESSERIGAIAQRCGFAGAAHFSTTFHQHRGVAPSQYRRQA